MPKHLDAFVLVFEMAPGKMDVPYVNGAHGVVVSHPLSMREHLGSIPSVSIFVFSQSSNVVFSAQLAIHAATQSERILKKNLHKVVKDLGQPHLGLGGCAAQAVVKNVHTRSRTWVVTATTRRPNH